MEKWTALVGDIFKYGSIFHAFDFESPNHPQSKRTWQCFENYQFFFHSVLIFVNGIAGNSLPFCTHLGYEVFIIFSHISPYVSNRPLIVLWTLHFPLCCPDSYFSLSYYFLLKKIDTRQRIGMLKSILFGKFKWKYVFILYKNIWHVMWLQVYLGVML